VMNDVTIDLMLDPCGIYLESSYYSLWISYSG